MQAFYRHRRAVGEITFQFRALPELHRKTSLAGHMVGSAGLSAALISKGLR
jgi:hypothetical protein